jgi:hypothetical protein
MADRTIITDIGREWIARFLASPEVMISAGYLPFYAARWGEGGWETIGGIDVPRDPIFNVAENNLDVILNPGSYGVLTYSSGLILIDQATETSYIGGALQHIRIRAHLDTSEANGPNNNSDDPRYGEVGIFDNALAAGLDAVDHMMFYSTIDPTRKNATREFDVDVDIPMNP